MKNILLLTDFSKSANNAIIYALYHFNYSPCHFFLMYVYKSGNFIMDDLMTSSSDTVYDAIIKDEKQELEHSLKKLKVLIYTKDNCIWCDRAKILLDSKKISYNEIDLSDDNERLKFYEKIGDNVKTVPQVFIDDKRIGGFQDLKVFLDE